jgi:hypothetical protein
VHDLVADLPGSDVSGPAHDARGAQVAFSSGEVRALPVAGAAPPQEHLLGAVVAGEDDKGVVRDPQLVEQVEQRPEVGVELQETVGLFALP